MKNDTKAMKGITRMYDGLGLEQQTVFQKAKLILSVYRDVAWSSIRKSEELKSGASELLGNSLSLGLMYLSDFAPDVDKEKFEAQVSFLFETSCMIELVDKAMIKVKEYHQNGEVYYEILSKSYLTPYRYKETELLEALDISRTHYYTLRREAISLLGVALWGSVIPTAGAVLDEAAAMPHVMPEEDPQDIFGTKAEHTLYTKKTL